MELKLGVNMTAKVAVVVVEVVAEVMGLEVEVTEVLEKCG